MLAALFLSILENDLYPTPETFMAHYIELAKFVAIESEFFCDTVELLVMLH
jgi:hypothetical protein